jgi:sialate O-acetylesterase
MKSITILGAALLVLASASRATLATGKVFGNHMVLQRGAPIPVFGTGAAGEGVTVTLGTATVTGTTGSGGQWKVLLPTMAAGGPFTLTIKGTNTITYTDVMVGEVWHCAGQSNMDTRMNYSEYPNLADSIKTANYPKLRYITMRQPGQAIQWQQVSPATVGSMTATGYFFGRHLLDRLGGVAVGIVNTSVGGTTIRQWLDPATLAATPDLADDDLAGAMYDAWIKPVEGYGVKGTVWLQGENDASSSALVGAYGRRLASLIPGWRKAWNQPDMPFLVAGLCHKGVAQTAPGESSNEALVREFQRGVTDTMRLTYLAVLLDLGDDATWHYPQKPQAGARLGLLARGAVYGEKGIVYQSPRPLQAFKRGTTLVIPFDPRGSSLKLSSGTAPTGFQVAGADGKWTWASTATLKGDTVFLTTALAAPTQVRHAWANQPVMNLWSAAGLPATPFQMAVAAGPVGVEEHRAKVPGRRAGILGFPRFGEIASHDLRGRRADAPIR